MGTTRLFIRSVLTLGLVAVVSGYGLAAERSSAAPDETVLKRASRVMNARVVSPQGENLGRVHDLVLTPDLNGISYVAVSRGGFLGMGNTLHAIPWSVLSPGLDGTYVAPITVAQFKQSRGFSPSNWPGSAESLWPASSMDRGDEPAYSTRAAAYSGDVHHRRFTRIKGSDVKGADGKKVGDIHDLVLAMDTGRIAYTIVSYGGMLGLGQRLAAVPENAITLEPALHVARVDAGKATLQANSFTPNRWPDLASPSYSQELARAFGVEPSGTVLGYVPPAGAVAAAPRTTPTPSAEPATPPAPNELMGTFNPATITTMDGTVTDVGKFKATATGQDMLWLRVRTTDGRPVLVNLGPRSYVGTQDFYIVRGDRIHLTGSEVATAVADKRVFLPTQVTYNNYVLRLRSETGTPLWEGRTTAPEAVPPSEREAAKPQSRAETSGTTALGYAPAEEPGAAAPAGRPLTPFAPADPMALDTLDLSKSRTIDGTVTEVGKSKAADGTEVVWLRVKTTNGQIVNVQVGPRDYVSRQGFFIVNGDRIHLTGWDARATGAPDAASVFVVEDVSLDGHTFQLRRHSGEPLWTSQPDIGGQPEPDTMGRTSTSETPSSEKATPGSVDTSKTRSGIAGGPNEPSKP